MTNLSKILRKGTALQNTLQKFDVGVLNQGHSAILLAHAIYGRGSFAGFGVCSLTLSTSF